MPAPYSHAHENMDAEARGRVKITSGKYAGHTGTVVSNVYQKSADYPDEWHNGHHVMLDSEVLVTVRWEQAVVRN